MISQLLKKELISNTTIVNEGYQLGDPDNISGAQYTALAKLIAKNVYQKASNNNALKELIRFPDKKSEAKNQQDIFLSNIISGPTLKSLLDDKDKRTNEHKNRAKSVNALLIFLDIPEPKWKEFKDLNESNQGQLRFIGDWYLYRYHYTDAWSKIKRTLIKILEGSGGLMNVQYHALKGDVLAGQAQLRGRILTITINHGGNETKTIEITAAIASEDTEVRVNNVFNAIIRSSRNTEPYTKHCVMEYVGNKNLKFPDDKIVAVYHKQKLPEEGEKVEEGDILEGKEDIVEFLARKNFEMTAMPFKRPFVDEIKDRNQIAISNHRPGFDAIKTILQGEKKWFSFSPHNDGSKSAPCNYFTFVFDEVRKEVTFSCKRYENGFVSFSGYVEYFRNQLVFKTSKKDWKAYQNNTILFYSVGIYNPQAQRIYASTTLVIGTENVNRNLKEIFFRTDLDMGTDKIFNYREFIETKAIKDFEKHTLIKMNNIYDDWPTIDNNIMLNFNEIKKYAHKYLAFIVNGYTEEDERILQITLEIDPLGFTKESAAIKYTDLSETEPIDYEGVASLWKKTLKLRNKAVGGQKSEYIFRIDNIDDTNVTILEGVSTDTDRYGLPSADRCFAIRHDKVPLDLQEVLKFETNFLAPKTPAYEALNKILKDATKFSVSDYFFKEHPSLRENRVSKSS